MLFLLGWHVVVAVACALLAPVLRHRALVLAAAAPAAAFGWSLVQVPGVVAGDRPVQTLTWAPALDLAVDLRLDGLSLLLCLVVSGVGTAVMLYAATYFAEREDGLARICALFVVFAGAMLALVLADHVLFLYVAWEVTTVCSFLLIGDAGATAEHRRAAVRALLLTAGPGLAMLLGLLLLAQQAGTYRLGAIVADPPQGAATTVAVALVLLGALAKAAQVPLHPWLPAAMVAPTPVSAYLHAAAMVKAGIYLLARLAPAFAADPVWRWLVPAVGVGTMLWGGWRALAQHDLKRLLAYGTIAQLGFLVVLVGSGSRVAALAGVTMLLAHALFKSTLFSVAGIIDHAAGTRDLRELSRLRHRSPALLVVAVLACASMVGFPVTVGYLGKEAAFEAFVPSDGLVDAAALGGLAVLVGIVVGSLLTVAYTARFLWGAFADRDGVEGPEHPVSSRAVAVAGGLAVTGVGLGFAPHALDTLLATYPDAYPQVWPGQAERFSLELWHGLGPPVVLSALTLAGGVLLHLATVRGPRWALGGHPGPSGEAVEDGLAHAVSRAATTLTQGLHPGSLPRYLATTLLVVCAVPAAGWLLSDGVVGPAAVRPWDTLVQPLLGLPLVAVVVAAVLTRRRLVQVLLVSVAGYLVAALFVVHGAPDLALVQVLVETLTLVVIVLVLRRLSPTVPARPAPRQALSVVVACVVGASAGAVLLLTSADHAPSAPTQAHLATAEEAGGTNTVNVIVTSFRALDTLAETTVLAVAATGVASLVLVTGRTGRAHAPTERSGGRRPDRRRSGPPGADERRPGAEVGS